MKRVLIIGGYGNFGRFIANMLAREVDIQVIIGGRSFAKAQAMTHALSARNPAEAACLDITDNIDHALASIAPDIVIHTSGPFQSQSYAVAAACIRNKCHYIDLADSRDFVAGIHSLNEQALASNVLICSGASSVPTLTSAIIDHHLGDFARLDSAEYAISTAQKTSRGLATTAAVLSYAGKSFSTLINGQPTDIYGWLDLRSRHFHGLGSRWLGNCDIPDLALFPQRYPTLRHLRFQAGLELKLIHGALFGLSWMVRLKLLKSLQPLARIMLAASRLADPFGSQSSGFYLELEGQDNTNQHTKIRFDLLAHHGDGMYIPCAPAILMAVKLARNQITERGAAPCMGFISLDEYLNLLKEFSITWQTRVT